MSLVDRWPDLYKNLENNNSTVKEKKRWVIWRIRIIIFILSIIILISIWTLITLDNKNKLTIDNPTLENIIVELNNIKKITIYPETSVEINIPNGKYEVKLNNKVVWSFEKKSFQHRYILNPTNYIYLQEYILYWDQKYENKIPNNIINIDSQELEWPFKKYEWLYFTWDWNYSLDDYLPESIKISWNYEIKSKIYRFFQFVDMYNNDYAAPESNTWSLN